MDYDDGIDSHVDSKWRLYLPVEIEKVSENVFLREDYKGGLRIFQNPQAGTIKRKLSVSNAGVRRITIPKSLRSSESFFFGKKVKIVFKDDCFKIFPRK